jgi:malate dehydrogenase (oxaloacetate-decarboxylating)(NADP+)
MPNIDAANISYNLLEVAAGNGIAIGPILLWRRQILSTSSHSSSTVRRIVNMATLAVIGIEHHSVRALFSEQIADARALV